MAQTFTKGKIERQHTQQHGRDEINRDAFSSAYCHYRRPRTDASETPAHAKQYTPEDETGVNEGVLGMRRAKREDVLERLFKSMIIK